MSTVVIANSFPSTWSYGQYEIDIHDSIRQQMDRRWPNSDNLLFSTTWMGPRTEQCIQDQSSLGATFENLVITSTVDPTLNFQVYPLIDRLVETFNIQRVYRVGNFDGEHEFNFFAIPCLDNFCHYEQQDLILRELKWRFCCYNRKPYQHRVAMVKELVSRELESYGVITLGRPFPGDADHGLYRSIGEKDEDYVKWGHWYDLNTEATPHEIPHDLYSLHNWDVWQHHFLHIVGSTAQWSAGCPGPDTFVNQINFKPLIGMRPFVINGQRKQYEYLRRREFRTFNHYWPQFNLEQDPLDDILAKVIADLVKWLVAKSHQEILDMYDDMLPDLIHNRQRWFEWAREQRHRVDNLLQ